MVEERSLNLMSGNPAGGVDELGHRWNKLEA